MQLLIARNGNQTGPFSEEQVRNMILGGTLSHDDLAWTDGASEWKPLHSVLELSQPPPLPRSSADASYSLAPSLPVTGPVGVGGWLLLFCVGITILGPLFAFFQMANGWVQAQPAFSALPAIKYVMIWENLGSTAIFVYGIIVGIKIWSGDPNGRTIARRFLIIRMIAFIGVELVALLMLSSLSAEIFAAGAAAVAGATIRAGIHFTIWWLYFKRSVRVRNTYGDEQDSQEDLAAYRAP